MRVPRFLLVALAALAVTPIGCREREAAPPEPPKLEVTLSDDQAAAGVEIVREGESIGFSRGEESFRIRGAGGPASLETLARLGGNATRTWGLDQLEDGLLDRAHEQGLEVAVGIWLRHDLDYADQAQVDEQIERALAGVRQFKDHPAVLLWGIGNEMEGDGSNPAVWEHVEEIAKRIKEEDPHHPTMTVLAEIGGEKVANLHRICSHIDIVGVNAYGGAASLPQRYREAGGTKPYILTEFGPRGPWDLQENEIGSLDEELGRVKAATYQESYRAAAADQELCLGSFAFKWGHKQEATPTWFGMFLADGRRTMAVDTMAAEWSGKPATNRCPEIESLTLVDGRTVKPGAELVAELAASDPEGDDMEVKWVLMEDAKRYFTGGYHQDTPPLFPERLGETSSERAMFRAPEEAGLYRIFAYVGDGQGGADSANVVFRVEP